MKTILLTLLALVAFAANSLLARLALVEGAIDAASFAGIRLGSGAAILAALVLARGGRPAGSWAGAAALALYAVPFALAYLALTAATGALILFGAVQITMIGVGLRQGERPAELEWVGLAVAVAGLVYLVSPGLAAPSPGGAAAMAVAGAAWGVYSLLGRGSGRPVATTAGNFLRATPLALGMMAVAGLAAGSVRITVWGALLAVVSGAVTSGLGYVVWYAALAGLTATRAATVQLAVPVLTAFGGVALLGEPITLRLVVASVPILGGVLLAIRYRPGPGRMAHRGLSRSGSPAQQRHGAKSGLDWGRPRPRKEPP